MTHGAIFRFVLGGAICMVAASACQRDRSPPRQLVDQPLDKHDLGPPSRKVKIKVKCSPEDDGLQIDWAIRPHRKKINVGDVMTWHLLPASNVPQVVVDAKDPTDWPFALSRYTVNRGAEIDTDAADPSDERTNPYPYTITAVCTVGSESLTSVLDPDLIVRGSKSVDSLGNPIQ